MFEIQRERIYECSVEDLWRAIATQESLTGWLMTCDFQPVVGHEFTFRTKPSPLFDGVVHAKVLVVNEPHYLKFAWRSGRIATEVAFTIESVDSQHTRLRLDHTGFTGFTGLVARIVLGMGWGKLLRKHLSQWINRDICD